MYEDCVYVCIMRDGVLIFFLGGRFRHTWLVCVCINPGTFLGGEVGSWMECVGVLFFLFFGPCKVLFYSFLLYVHR